LSFRNKTITALKISFSVVFWHRDLIDLGYKIPKYPCIDEYPVSISSNKLVPHPSAG
jgi:hypothetical protein